jgi:hypothetical protein
MLAHAALAFLVLCCVCRWCTSMALFLKAVKQDEHLADSLAFRLNKW